MKLNWGVLFRNNLSSTFFSIDEIEKIDKICKCRFRRLLNLSLCLCFEVHGIDYILNKVVLTFCNFQYIYFFSSLLLKYFGRMSRSSQMQFAYLLNMVHFLSSSNYLMLYWKVICSNYFKAYQIFSAPQPFKR
jgi:hypothetical protein